MEEGESLLDTLFDEENVDIGLDIEMLDAEEGEIIELKRAEQESCVDGFEHGKGESSRKNSKHKKRKKKNRQKRSSSKDSNVPSVNRFVSDACKHLREKKSYLMWTAVGCLGVSYLSNLLNEVNAIQTCGGQKTVDGTRFRNGGGILWNLIKVRDPNAYKEIMKKGKEFEKQFKQQVNCKQQVEYSSQSNPSTCLNMTSEDNIQVATSSVLKKSGSVRERIRMPVSYDDDLISAENRNDAC